MRGRRAAATIALVVAVLATGCLSLGAGDPVENREYDLIDASVGSRSVAPIRSSATFQVEPFSVDGVLDRDSIVWRRGVEVGAYGHHRWARAPQQAARELVAAAIQRRLAWVVVVTDPPIADPELVLRAELTRCEEVDRGEEWFGVAELNVLVARRDGLELLRARHTGEERALARNPAGVVEALRRVLDRLADEVAADVAGVVARREGDRTQ